MARFETQRVVPKTANYTISPAVDKNGTLFTNEAASGTVIFTLPTPNRALLGQGYEFLSLVAQILRVAGAGSTDIVTVANTGAASVSGPAAAGARLLAKCVRTASTGTYKWYVSGTNGQTYTVA